MRNKWTEQSIGAAILASSSGGVMPTNSELIMTGNGALSSAIQTSGGFPAWAGKLGLSTKTRRVKWTEELVESELRELTKSINRMPTNSELSEWGRSDLSNQIVKKGGFFYWAERLGVDRVKSDSDTGWAGEDALESILKDKGFGVEQTALRAPYDLKVNEVVRVDVKTAKFAEYGACRGWFYRVGKEAQADVIALYQLDTGDVYFLPWHHCPKSNVTISRSGGKYRNYKNRYDIIEKLSRLRYAEDRIWSN